MINRLPILVFALLSSCSLAFGQANYYVSPTGNNTNAGNSLAQPWATVQHGLDQINPGDTLNLTAGSYNEKISFPTSGTAAMQITLRNYDNDAVFLDGGAISSQEAIIEIVDVSWITVSGLHIHNNVMNDAQGILVEGNCSHISLLDNDVYNIHFSPNPVAPVNAMTNAQPIIVYGTDPSAPITNLLIQGNSVRNSRTGYSEGLAVNGNVESFQVVDNEVHDISNIGIDIIGHEGTCPDPALDQARLGEVRGNLVYNCLATYATSAGIYVDGAKLLNIENNTVYQCGYGIEVGCEAIGKTASQVTVRNNIMYDNEIAGLALGGYDYPSGSGAVVEANIRNNTLYANNFTNDATGEILLSYCDSCRLRNNILYTSAQGLVLTASNLNASLVMDYNLTYSPGGNDVYYQWGGVAINTFAFFQYATGQEANSQYADPEFVAPSINNPDFHIPITSPAVDAGDPGTIISILETDLDGNPRVEGGRIDVGADEYNPPVGAADFVEEVVYSLYPNPAQDMLHLELPQGGLQPEFQLINLQGQELAKGRFPETGMRVAHFPQGVYLLRLYDKKGNVATRKIVLR